MNRCVGRWFCPHITFSFTVHKNLTGICTLENFELARNQGFQTPWLIESPQRPLRLIRFKLSKDWQKRLKNIYYYICIYVTYHRNMTYAIIWHVKWCISDSYVWLAAGSQVWVEGKIWYWRCMASGESSSQCSLCPICRCKLLASEAKTSCYG